MRSAAPENWTGGWDQVNCVPEETLVGISSPVLRPNLYSPSGLIALLGPIIQTWMNTKHLTPPFLSSTPFLALPLFSLHSPFPYQRLLCSCPHCSSSLLHVLSTYLPSLLVPEEGPERRTGHFRDQRHEVIQAEL